MVVTLQPFLTHLTRLLSKNYTKSALKKNFYLNVTETADNKLNIIEEMIYYPFMSCFTLSI